LTFVIPNGILPDMNNRDVILENALLHFASYGYEAAVIQDICDASGITKPTLYHYFRSKRGLMEALLKENFTPFIARLNDACDYRRDLTLNLEQVIRAYFRFAESNPLFYKLQYAMRNAPTRSETYEIIRPWVKAQYEPVHTLFSKAEADHGNLRGHANANTITLHGMIHAYIHQAFEDNSYLEDEILYRARQQFMYGIFS
jgi:AcrR family transcriptional regulator